MDESDDAPRVHVEITPIFSLDIATRMAQTLGAHSEHDAKRLHSILNDYSSPAGAVAYSIAYYLKTPGPRPNEQRRHLKRMGEAFKNAVDLYDCAHWQIRELVSAGYAREFPVFAVAPPNTTTGPPTEFHISRSTYDKMQADIEAARRLENNIQFAALNTDTATKNKLSNLERLAYHLVEAYEAFTGHTVRGERRTNRDDTAKVFMESGLNYITTNQYTSSQIATAIRRAAEKRRKGTRRR